VDVDVVEIGNLQYLLAVVAAINSGHVIARNISSSVRPGLKAGSAPLLFREQPHNDAAK
jgi:hypothetical protein